MFKCRVTTIFHTGNKKYENFIFEIFYFRWFFVLTFISIGLKRRHHKVVFTEIRDCITIIYVIWDFLIWDFYYLNYFIWWFGSDPFYNILLKKLQLPYFEAGADTAFHTWRGGGRRNKRTKLKQRGAGGGAQSGGRNYVLTLSGQLKKITIGETSHKQSCLFWSN